ncbi:hypothetical protein CO2235_230024 [Cupriavidus oxalaticus]|uniref:Uncharacterized protein n=1 Tax=Cupriavidus oxalaticus TaxID=96344 RepID=A0A375G589_9BURK|nr:hypothetical protein CO2235_230024 [Cupriavidus oxalaticus]
MSGESEEVVMLETGERKEIGDVRCAPRGLARYQRRIGGGNRREQGEAPDAPHRRARPHALHRRPALRNGGFYHPCPGSGAAVKCARGASVRDPAFVRPRRYTRARRSSSLL